MPATAQGQPLAGGGLFSDADSVLRRYAELPRAASTIAVPGVTTLRSRAVDIDFRQLAEARAAGVLADAPAGNVDALDLSLNLFDDVVLSAVVERSAATGSGSGYIVSGRLDDVESGTWKLQVYDDVITGTIRTPSGTYVIRTVGGAHVISQIDTSARPPFEDRVVRAPVGERPLAALSAPDPGLPDAVGRAADPFGEAVIDVAVAYTADAEAGAERLKGDAGIEGLIHEMIDNAHEAFERSGVFMRLRLAWSGPLACRGSVCSDIHEALDYLATRENLRTFYGADILTWITDTDMPGNTLGIARHGGNYSVVNYDAEVDYYTFAHELGHNMFLLHDRWTVLNVPPKDSTDDDGMPVKRVLNDPYPYSHGYISTDCSWRTIMSYPHRCTKESAEGQVLRNFSNPNRLHHSGERMGVFGSSPSLDEDGPADAVRSLNEKRWEVARFWHPSSDREALYTFFATIRASGRVVSSVPRNWLRFDAQDRAIRVQLGGSQLSGELPDYLGTLAELEYFGLSPNFFTGPIPATFGRLVRLESLNLAYNELTGEIPAALGDLTRLQGLDLQGNQLSGPIPSELGELKAPHSLDLSHNELTGPIPAELGAG